MKRYVRKGVPCEHRAQMWMAASGAHDQMGRNPGYYHSLLKAQHDPEVEDAVRAGRFYSSHGIMVYNIFDSA